MALDGTAFAGWADRFARYAEGKSPCELVPVGGGPAVPFIHDERTTHFDSTEAGALEREVLIVMVRRAIPVAGQYIFGGEQWTVDRCEPDRMGGVLWPYRAELVSHVR